VVDGADPQSFPAILVVEASARSTDTAQASIRLFRTLFDRVLKGDERHRFYSATSAWRREPPIYRRKRTAPPENPARWSNVQHRTIARIEESWRRRSPTVITCDEHSILRILFGTGLRQ
jgi:hypothetical protein